MPRPPQVTLAVGIILCCGALELVAAVLVSTAPVTADSRIHFRIFLALGVSAIATAAGLLLHQRWARTFALLFVGLASYGGFAISPVILFLPLALPPGSPLTQGQGRLIILSLAAISFWLACLLSTEPTREFFGVRSARRHFSITAIGWCMLLSGIVGAAFLLRIRQPPMLAFGLVIVGWRALSMRISDAAAELYLGINLLREKPRSREFTIYYGLFQLLNAAVFFLRPDREAQVRAFYALRLLYSASTFSSPSMLSRYLRLATLESSIFTLIAIWFLATNRDMIASGMPTEVRPCD